MLKGVRQEGCSMAELNSKEQVIQWLEQCVIGLSLCPYARVPVEAGQVSLVVCQSSAAKDFVNLLLDEARALKNLAGEIETTLIIAPDGFEDFLHFNDIAGDAEDALAEAELDQDFQLASFHPDYLFAEDASDDPSHFTNRAPFPILQLLRVSTVAKAVDTGDTLSIPQRNCERLRAMPLSKLRELFPWSGHWIIN